MARLDNMSYGSAALLGFFLQPWSLVAAGAMVVLTSSLDGFWEYLALVYFCLLSTATLLAAELYMVFRPVAAKERLDRLRLWIDTHRDQGIVIISLIAGVYLMGSSLLPTGHRVLIRRPALLEPVLSASCSRSVRRP